MHGLTQLRQALWVDIVMQNPDAIARMVKQLDVEMPPEKFGLLVYCYQIF